MAPRVAASKNCKTCDEVDSSEMVQCETCDDWHHYACVGVDSAVEAPGVIWKCRKCDMDETVVDVASETTEELAATVRELERRLELTKRRHELERQLKELTMQEQAAIPETYQGNFASSTSPKPPSQRTSVPASTNTIKRRIDEQATTSTNTLTREQQLSSGIAKRGDYMESKPMPYNLPRKEITAEQIAARKFIPKTLPEFWGSVDQWPIFYSNYRTGIEVAGFTDEENLIRLQNSLKGAARTYVEGSLTLPGNVPHIINRLKARYGDEQKIIENQLEKIKRLPSPSQDDLQSTIDFGAAVHNLITTMRTAELQDHLNDPSILRQLINHLPPSLKLEWAKYTRGQKQNLERFDEWIDGMATDACRVQSADTKRSYKPGRLNVHTDVKWIPANCLVCKSTCKTVPECRVFVKYHRNKKWQTVRDLSLCRTCLRKHSGACRVKEKCGQNGCEYRHHKLLHDNEAHNSTNRRSAVRAQTENQQQDGHKRPIQQDAVQLSHCSTVRNAIFRIIPVVIKNGNREETTYAFLDEGSSVSLIDETIAKKLKLQGENKPLCLQWTGNTTRTEPESKSLSFTIRGTSSNKEFTPINNVHTVKCLSLPQQSLNIQQLATKYRHLQGLPIQSYKNAKPTVLIGMDNWRLGATLQIKEGADDEPLATKTRLGWTVYGRTSKVAEDPQSLNLHYCECQPPDDLHQLLRESYELEKIGSSKRDTSMSKEDQRALKILKNTSKHTGVRFETGLLWANDDINLPDSRPMALHRFRCVQKRLKRDSLLTEKVQSIMRNHEEMGYVEKLTEEEAAYHDERTWYSPVFPTANPNKPGSVRLVWDDGALVNGISLNSMLLKGPDQVPPLIQPLTRFRERKIAVCGDIKQMFHQVEIIQSDRNAQRFYWLEDLSDEKRLPDVYRMKFGATSSPCSAQYIKNLNASQYEKSHPRAFKCIVENHYVDDMLDSYDTLEEAIEVVTDVQNIQAQAGFILGKWRSNSSKLRATLGGSLQTTTNMDLGSTTEKLLGMWYDTSDDCFTYSLNLNRVNSKVLSGEVMPTKRETLRILMSVFDPMGHIAHFLVHLKIIIQNLWRSGRNWDETISDEVRTAWLKWIRVLSDVNHLRIPRSYLRTIENYDNANVEIHTFCDAGAEAYSTVSYIRVQSGLEVNVSQLGAKVKVAPIKAVSIPRLELEAALIGARHVKFLKSCLTIKVHREMYYTDSSTTHSWIRADHRRWSAYVSFRVSEIQELTNVNDWYWIPTKQNVADEATKSTNVPVLDASARWFTGPSWLKEPQESWPIKSLECLPRNNEEMRKGTAVEVVAHQLKLETLIDVSRFSDWSRLLRTIARIHRFINLLKMKRTRQVLKTNCLTVQEIQQAERTLFKIAQAEQFYDELLAIKQGKSVANSSAIYQCSPFMDENDVLRMESRIVYAEIRASTKTPIILPKTSRITYLLVKSYHKILLHQHHETVVNELRKRFFIPKLRQLVKKVAAECQACRIRKTKPSIPRMAPLPPGRMAIYQPPFTHTGLDYFGPIPVTIGRSVQKRYGALFTCLTTRAVHIEIAHSLTTSSCILVIRNFINRRGNPKAIYSDNGSNFVGADSLLRKELRNLKKADIAEECISKGITWNFNPPETPHMGGVWERLVRSIKTALYAALPSNRNLTDETLLSSMIEVENIVNSRPLVYLPIDSPEQEALTPNHFLRGSSEGGQLFTAPDDRTASLLSNWRTSQWFANRFWKRWIAEVLPEYTRRAKWCKDTTPIKVGDIVFVVDIHNPGCNWPRGIIKEIYPGSDGRVRRAMVRINNKDSIKSIANLAVIPVRSLEANQDRASNDREGEC